MAVWETEPALAAQSALTADFAQVWQAADKVVYSTTLDAVSTAKTRLEPRFDPDFIRENRTRTWRSSRLVCERLAPYGRPRWGRYLCRFLRAVARGLW